MTIREAREKLLYEKASNLSGTELMSAFFYIANSADIRRMADVLEVEHQAQVLKRATDHIK